MRYRTWLLRLKRNKPKNSILLHLVSAPARRVRRLLVEKKLSNLQSLEDRFTLIYNRNLWSSKESVSGSGSTLAMTESIRSLLPVIIEDYDIESILDAPCGDFSWMSHVNLQGVRYLGVDIVMPLIVDLQKKYASEGISFMCLDITKDSLPKSDLVITRDCLFHLSYQDILSTLNNFIDSGSKYFLTTSYDNQGEFRNVDIFSGGFRLIDLFSSPFEFPSTFKFQIREPSEGRLPPRSLFLWDRGQVNVAYRNLEFFLIEQQGKNF